MSLMKARMIMGGLRYGILGEPGKPEYNRIGSIRKRLEFYEQTGNAEYLLDIANEACCEFEEPTHELYHYSPIDDGYHTEVK